MKKIFLLGDSVCLHYLPYLETYLKGKLTIESKAGRDEALRQINKTVGANGGNSKEVLKYVKEKAANDDLNFDAFVFNCGLLDIKREIPEEKLAVSVEEYEENLREIYEIIKKNGKMCVFITTTPVNQKAHNEQLPDGINRYNKDVYEYNEVAKKIAIVYNMPVIDLCGFISKVTDGLYADYAHFSFPTRRLQAAFVAGELLTLLDIKDMD